MHNWFRFCPDPNAFENVRTASQFIKASQKQSNTPAGQAVYRENLTHLNPGKPKDVGKNTILSPKLFGASIEALAECYFNTFGHYYNLTDYMSQDETLEDKEDTGYDALASTIKSKQYGTLIKKVAKPGSPVYIQIKGRLNPTKLHYTNDGSNLMNAFGNSQAHARRIGEAYSARYILFTTGAGLHWILEKNTFNDIEVINFNNIRKFVDQNIPFWNQVRKKLGLTRLHVSGPKDPQYVTMQAEIEQLEQERNARIAESE